MTLTIQDLGALGELLGSVAVLATLVYLALQTRQNTLAISAQLDAARLRSVANLNLAVATSTELEEALNEDRVEPMAMNELRRVQFWTSQLVLYQWQVAQARRGLLPTFNEPAIAATVRGHFANSRSFEGWWEAWTTAGGFDPEFVEWVDEQRAKATGQEA